MPASFEIQALLFAVPPLVFLVLAAWCVPRIGTGLWAGLGAAGAGLLAVALGIPAASNIEAVFFDTIEIAEALLLRQHATSALAVGQAAGAVLLGAAFLLARRNPPERALYGPPSD